MGDQQGPSRSAGVAHMTTAPITYAQLIRAMGEDVSWARVYLTNTKSEEWHNQIEKRESLRMYGEMTVKRAMPGYRFLLIWLEA